MCTVGVLRVGAGDYLLFKNKDFVRTHFDDRLVVESEVFGVRGVSTWAGTDPERDEFSGFSIGANSAGLLCCDANVHGRQTPRPASGPPTRRSTRWARPRPPRWYTVAPSRLSAVPNGGKTGADDRGNHQ